MSFFYSNKDDPRVFVYRDEKGPSGYGVTLNFAHRKAWVIMVAFLVLMLPMWFPIFVNSAREISSPAMFISLYVMYCVCFAVLNVVMAFRGAARDLKRHPGQKGPRKPKGVAK